jgi:hypothetical protein
MHLPLPTAAASSAYPPIDVYKQRLSAFTGGPGVRGFGGLRRLEGALRHNKAHLFLWHLFL